MTNSNQLPELIAHRGASAYAPENTMPAFKRLRQFACQFVEYDVMLTQDAIPVVHHDFSLARTTNKQAQLADCDYTMLQTLDAGSWFDRRFKSARIPSLQQVLQFLNKQHIHSNIELKSPDAKQDRLVEKVYECILLNKQGDLSLPLISSFQWSLLVAMRDLSKEIPIGVLLDSWDETVFTYIQRLRASSLHINVSLVSKERITHIKQQCPGLNIYAYTVNDRHVAHHCAAAGVDAIFSDHPDLFTPML